MPRRRGDDKGHLRHGGLLEQGGDERLQDMWVSVLFVDMYEPAPAGEGNLKRLREEIEWKTAEWYD